MNDSGIQSDENDLLTSGSSGVGLQEPEAGKSEFRKIQRSHDRELRQPPPREPARRPWIRIAIAVAAIVGISVAVPYLPLRPRSREHGRRVYRRARRCDQPPRGGSRCEDLR